MREVGARTGERAGTVSEVARYMVRLGFIAFGGPAAHVAIMRRELVEQRKWVTDQEFIDMLGVTNLIPGPNSTEMTMHLGARRAGWWGLWVGGLGFIGPAVAIVLALAWAYVRWGETPAGEALVYGIQPFILAIIAQAIWGLRGAAVKGIATAVAGVLVVVLALLGLNEAVAIIGAGVAMTLWRFTLGRPRSGGEGGGVVPLRRRRFPFPRIPWRRIALLPGQAAGLAAMPLLPLKPLLPASSHLAGYSLTELFLIFLKIGAVLYGSGYVLIAFMQTDLVANREWLTEQQLIDAIAVGQFTPGPVFTAATFAGYVIGSWQGAAAATAGIFLPSFFFVAATHPFIARLRQSPWASPFLDGVNVAALALMAVVTVRLALEVLDDWYTAGLFAIAVIVLVRFSPNSALLVLAGSAAGLVHLAAT